jgi:hypothetical protein
MCTVLLPPGVNPTAVNKYIISINQKQNGFTINIVKEVYVKDGRLLELRVTWTQQELCIS